MQRSHDYHTVLPYKSDDKQFTGLFIVRTCHYNVGQDATSTTDVAAAADARFHGDGRRSP